MRYEEIRTAGGRAFLKPEGRPALAGADAVIFDCDGVLIDVRPSYDVAISRTVSYILGKLKGCNFARAATRRLIYEFRRSGGFNNDWDTTYVILLAMFLSLDPEFLCEFLNAHKQCGGKGRLDAAERLKAYVAGVRRPKTLKEVIELRHPFPPPQIRRRAMALAEGADSSGIPSVERQIADHWDLSELKKKALEAFKQFLEYPGEMGRSLVTTVFNELFYGADYCRSVYGVEPKFNTGAGLVENEKPILRSPTLVSLVSGQFGSKLGIVSGRALRSARKTLGTLLDPFNSAALVFIEDLLETEGKGRAAEISKPAPFGLFKAAKALGPFRRAVYVGDSAEDFIMVGRANEQDRRYLFAGVYRYGNGPQRKIELFKELGAELIIPSVNELPEVLSCINRET